MSCDGIKPGQTPRSGAEYLRSGKQKRTSSRRKAARHRRSLGRSVPGIAPERHSLLRADIIRILPAKSCSDPPASLLLRNIYIIQIEYIFVQALIRQIPQYSLPVKITQNFSGSFFNKDIEQNGCRRSLRHGGKPGTAKHILILRGKEADRSVRIRDHVLCGIVLYLAAIRTQGRKSRFNITRGIRSEILNINAYAFCPECFFNKFRRSSTVKVS